MISPSLSKQLKVCSNLGFWRAKWTNQMAFGSHSLESSTQIVGSVMLQSSSGGSRTYQGSKLGFVGRMDYFIFPIWINLDKNYLYSY